MGGWAGICGDGLAYEGMGWHVWGWDGMCEDGLACVGMGWHMWGWAGISGGSEGRPLWVFGWCQ